jgi:adenylate cyclase class 2
VIEHEVKIAFEDVESARRAVHAAGGRLLIARRLIDDTLFDTADRHLRQGGCTLRVRRAADLSFITFKGPVQPGEVKSREEIETAVGDATLVEAIMTSLGFRRYFRGQKYREEYEVRHAHVCVDEAPMGVFVEIEGQPAEIQHVTILLGRTAADHELDSYQRLHARWCEMRGTTPGDMVFPDVS